MSFGYTLVEGDQPLLQTTVKQRSDRTVLSLAGLSTRQIRYWQDDGPVTTAAAALVGAESAGTIQYQITSGIQSGQLFWEWIISDGTNPKMATRHDGKPFQINVRKRH